MSRRAYENYFGVPAPPGAIFGVDISWFQSYASWSTTRGYWADFGGWASFVCVRTSYGRGGADGAEQYHFQVADEVGYKGALGTYHYAIPTSGADGNLTNYFAASDPYVDQTSFDMIDWEESPPPSVAMIDEVHDRVMQRRQRPCLVYGGKSYMDQAGAMATCPIDHYWAAHYPGRSATPWSPTTSWSAWGAPLMPDQYGGMGTPGVWQWQSLTPEHGSLDLNISTTPETFGAKVGPPEKPKPEDEDMAFQAIAPDGTKWMVNLPFKQEMDNDALREVYEAMGWLKPGQTVNPWTLDQLVDVSPLGGFSTGTREALEAAQAARAAADAAVAALGVLPQQVAGTIAKAIADAMRTVTVSASVDYDRMKAAFEAAIADVIKRAVTPPPPPPPVPHVIAP